MEKERVGVLGGEALDVGEGMGVEGGVGGVQVGGGGPGGETGGEVSEGDGGIGFEGGVCCCVSCQHRLIWRG